MRSMCVCVCRFDKMALKAELDRNENVYKHVAIQEAEERRLRDEELERMRLQWLEQMKVPTDRVVSQEHSSVVKNRKSRLFHTLSS